MRSGLLFTFLLIRVVSLGQVSGPINLVGLWSNTPEYVMSYQDCYQFYPDGNFKFTFDKVHCGHSCSTYYHKGTWRVDKDSLVLSILEKKVIVDGQFFTMEQDGYIQIMHTGEDSIIKLAIPEIEKLNLKLFLNFDNATECILIGERKFWKLEKDPYSREVD